MITYKFTRPDGVKDSINSMRPNATGIMVSENSYSGEYAVSITLRKNPKSALDQLNREQKKQPWLSEWVMVEFTEVKLESKTMNAKKTTKTTKTRKPRKTPAERMVAQKEKLILDLGKIMDKLDDGVLKERGRLEKEIDKLMRASEKRVNKMIAESEEIGDIIDELQTEIAEIKNPE